MLRFKRFGAQPSSTYLLNLKILLWGFPCEGRLGRAEPPIQSHVAKRYRASDPEAMEGKEVPRDPREAARVKELSRGHGWPWKIPHFKGYFF